MIARKGSDRVGARCLRKVGGAQGSLRLGRTRRFSCYGRPDIDEQELRDRMQVSVI